MVKSHPHIDAYIEWVHELYLNGIPLSSDSIDLLVRNEIISGEGAVKAPFFPESFRATERPIIVKTKKEKSADSRVDVVYSDESSTEQAVRIINDTTELESEAIRFSGGRKIERKDWLPHFGNVLEPEKDFIEWIDSSLNGFSHIKEYRRFDLYIQQADEWLADGLSLADCRTHDEVIDFVIEERNRWRENSLYFANKYLYLKQGAEEAGAGVVNFKAWRSQAFIAYLIDCGFSVGIGKLRQVGGTSLIGGIAIKKMLCHPNLFIKFITENVKKAQEIFNDKIKYAFYELPQVFRPTVKNDTGEMLTFAPKNRKGQGKRRDARLVVEAPYATAINGGTPDLVLVDEIGQIPILGEMINEGRPTMFKVSATTGKMEMVRQLVMWGTGANMDRAGAEFESQFRTWVRAWKSRDLRSGIIPVFLDCFSKPSITKEFYEEEKRRVYSIEGVNKHVLRIQFHQHYPVTIDDMFLRSTKTIVPLDLIVKHETELLSEKRTERAGHGFFEPIFDFSSPMPEYADVPYKVIGATWVPTDDSDERGVIYIHRHPELNWKKRYYQGTDPVNSESGTSLMASSVWDEQLKETSAVMNFRVPNFRYCYLQTALLNMYYGKCPHLFESNIGMNLRDYLYQMGLYETFVTNAMLPDYLQVATSQTFGIRLMPTIKPRFIHIVIMVIEAFGSGVKTLTFWSQLKTYVEKTTPSGNTKWAPENLKLYNDDVIDAIGFSYVCRMSHERDFPINTSEEVASRAVARKLVYDPEIGRNVLRSSMR